ncbi:hypothetical protein [Polynucleobacter sp. JS-Fieb-80-E5]|uniref:hypothetical protein n=1 Tax=Polynucleobacter sp. JS-Fieb-80-E5 TaxID=2081050 RepID=UPI001C0AE10D|nr:hypothetical protein [Polynucleobacter sp. JS-Fieb-80-E5]MBU3618169.1 hypothetical protein [Polynucleobacter sp. JS-Fieb-80-E5]
MIHQDPSHSHPPDQNHAQYQSAAQHFHGKAANHHEQAMKSHLEAARMRDLDNHEASATHALVAHVHALVAHVHALKALQNSEDAINEHANIQSAVQRP